MNALLLLHIYIFLGLARGNVYKVNYHNAMNVQYQSSKICLKADTCSLRI